MTPARERVLAALRAACIAYPELRACQIIVNATGRDDPFYVEDAVLAAALERYARVPPGR